MRNKSSGEACVEFMVAAIVAVIVCVVVTGDTLIIWPVAAALWILGKAFLR